MSPHSAGLPPFFFFSARVPPRTCMNSSGILFFSKWTQESDLINKRLQPDCGETLFQSPLRLNSGDYYVDNARDPCLAHELIHNGRPSYFESTKREKYCSSIWV